MDLAAAEHKPLHSHQVSIECASHLHTGLHPDQRRIVSRRIVLLLKAMQKRGLKFDAIAARGLSGFLFAPIVAMELNKTLLVVRKGESCHSGRTVEGDYGARSYVIIDDFISSGNTVKAIIADIAKEVPTAVCAGMVRYHNLDADDMWVKKSLDYRIERHFYDVQTLGGYSDAIRGQERRAADVLARRQAAYGIGGLAQEEFQRRQPLPKATMYNIPCLNMLTAPDWFYQYKAGV